MSDPTISGINRQLESHDRWRVTVESRLADIHKTLYGNGVPGWDEMLRELYKDYQDRKEAEKDAKKESLKVDKEIKLMGIKVSSETKITIINGVVTILAVVLTAVLVGK